MYGVDLANDLLAREVERATRAAVRVTHLVAVRNTRNTVQIGVHEWRPGQQDEHLHSDYAILPHNSLRSRRWAMAWVDLDGKLHVRGNSELLKSLLTRQFHVLATATMDEPAYAARDI